MRKLTKWMLAGLTMGLCLSAGFDAYADQEVLAEQVIWEAENVTLTAVGMSEDENYLYVEIKAENNDGGNLVAMLDDVSVNGVDIPGSYYCEIPAGASEVESLQIEKKYFALAEIDAVAALDMDLVLFDPVTYENVAESDLIHLTTEGNEDYEQTFSYSGEVVYDENGIKILYKGCFVDEYSDGTMVFFLENHSGKEISCEGQNVHVNGILSDGWLYTAVPDDQAALDVIYLWDYWMTENGIDEVENVQIDLEILDLGSYETIDTFTWQTDAAAQAAEAEISEEDVDTVVIDKDEMEEEENFFQAAANHAEEGEGDSDKQYSQSFSEPVVLSQDGVTLTALGIEELEEGYSVDFQFTNELEYPVLASVQDVFVNKGSILTGNMWEVGAEDSMRGSLLISRESMERWNFDRIASLDFEINCYAGGDFFDQEDTIELFTSVSLTTEGNEDYVQEYDIQGEVVYENEKIRILSIGIEEDPFGQNILLYVENLSDEDYFVSGQDIIVDGSTGDGFLTYQFNAAVPSGMHAISWISDDLGFEEEVGVSSLEMTLSISNMRTYEEMESTYVSFDPVE